MRTIFAWPLVCVLIIAGQGVDFEIKPVEFARSVLPALGTARLYSTEWRVVTYLSLEGASNNVDEVRKYVEFTVDFCTGHSNIWQPKSTVCKSDSYC